VPGGAPGGPATGAPRPRGRAVHRPPYPVRPGNLRLIGGGPPCARRSVTTC